jgi:hypothetical protein
MAEKQRRRTDATQRVPGSAKATFFRGANSDFVCPACLGIVPRLQHSTAIGAPVLTYAAGPGLRRDDSRRRCAEGGPPHAIHEQLNQFPRALEPFRSGSRETSDVWRASRPNSHEFGYDVSRRLADVLLTPSCTQFRLPREFCLELSALKYDDVHDAAV